MKTMEWRNSMVVDKGMIDSDHRNPVQIINEFIVIGANDASRKDLAQLLI